MMIRISFPGQPVQVVPMPEHIRQHFATKGWPLPFIEVLDGTP